MLSGAAALHQPNPVTHQSMTWFSDDGTHWSKGHKIGDPNMWLWGMRWNDGDVYSIGYRTGKSGPKFTRLYKSSDGKQYETVVDKLIDKGYVNESSLVFTKDKTCYCLQRRDTTGDNTGLLGTSKPPYTNWQWKDLGVRIGGPRTLPTARWSFSGNRASVFAETTYVDLPNRCRERHAHRTAGTPQRRRYQLRQHGPARWPAECQLLFQP